MRVINSWPHQLPIKLILAIIYLMVGWLWLGNSLAIASDLQVSVTVNKRKLALDDTVMLTISLRGVSVDHITIPNPFPSNFTVITSSDKSSLGQDAAGQAIRNRIIRYQLQPLNPGSFRIGAFSLSYAGETRKFPGELIEVQGGNGAGKSLNHKPLATTPSEPPPPRPIAAPLNVPIEVKIAGELDQKQLYVGEPITLSVRITSTAQLEQIKPVDVPPFTNFWNKEIGVVEKQSERREFFSGNKPYVTQLIDKYRLYPTTSGKLNIPAISYSMVASTNGGKTSKTLLLKTLPLTVDTLALPEKQRPSEFRGAVGNCKFHVGLKDTALAVGVPTKLTLEVQTDGNVDALTPPLLPKLPDIKIYDPVNIKLTPAERTQGIARWEAEVVATKAGTLTLPAIKFAYFEPTSHQYKTIESQPLNLVVASVASPLSSPSTNPVNIARKGFSIGQLVGYSVILLIVLLSLLLAIKFKLGTSSKRALATESAANKADLPSTSAILNTYQPPVAPIATTNISPAPAKPPAALKGKLELAPSPPPGNLDTEVNRLINGAYGKLHRGDEKAYANEILKALRLILQTGWGVSTNELNAEKITKLLSSKVSSSISQEIAQLYQSCEETAFSPLPANHVPDSKQDYQRFLKVRSLLQELLANTSK